MNEKPEALRLADRMAEGTGLDTQWDAAKELRRLHAENERLRKALGALLSLHDDPCAYDAATTRAAARAALRREET